MAVKRLTDGVDENDIVDLTDVEELNAPNILIDEEYGITGKYTDYAVVQRKIAHRTGKEEDGENEGKVIRYIKWDDINYSNTIFGCLTNYCTYVNLSKTKTLNKCKDFAKIELIYQSTKDTIDKFLSNYNMTDEQSELTKLLDNITLLNMKLEDAKKVFSSVEELRELVKEKRKIVINDTEPKKHRVKEEK